MSSCPKKTKDKPKRTLKKWTVSEKLEIIEKRDNGAGWTKIAQEKGMSESTVRSIYAQKDEIRARGKFQKFMF